MADIYVSGDIKSDDGADVTWDALVTSESISLFSSTPKPLVDFAPRADFFAPLKLNHQGSLSFYPGYTVRMGGSRAVTSSAPATIGTVTVGGSVLWQKDVPWIALTFANDTIISGSKILDHSPWLDRIPEDFLPGEQTMRGTLPATIGTLTREGDILWQKNVEWVVLLSRATQCTIYDEVPEDTVWTQDLPDGWLSSDPESGTYDLPFSHMVARYGE
jgi:hypothetical protein